MAFLSGYIYVKEGKGQHKKRLPTIGATFRLYIAFM